MHAITISEPGGPDVLRWTEVADPVPAAGEVLLDVAASAVNRADVQQRQGNYPPPKGASEILGLECSGTISALGEGVTGWQVGERVCALLAGGGYAEQVAVPQGQLLPLPESVDLVTAAALPEVACTVWSNVVSYAGLSRGDVLLVHGGSGGIGTHAIQLGKAFGATVAVTAGSAQRLARCAELGADITINYREQDFVDELRGATGGHGADVILDNMGAKYLQSNVDALAKDGRLVVIGLQGGNTGELSLGSMLGKRATLHAAGLRGRTLEDKAAIVAEVGQRL
ncbi:MAG: NAD(P)H-quinone oxidoreductase, partial [Sciscionella sp.]